MTLYFTRTDTGFRGWFQVVRSTGQLRTDILSSSFTALVVDATDTTSSLMTVTQSQQKQGLYRFDVPAAFLVSNGSGEYGISVEVNEVTSPKITTAFSNILKVSQDDFDSLSGSIVIGPVTGSFTVDVDAIVSGVWEANRLNFTSSVDSFGWTVDRMFQTQSLIYDNTVNLVYSASQIFNNTTTIVSNTNDLLYSASLIYGDTQHISSSVDLIFEDTQNLIYSSSQIYNETQNLIYSSSQIFNNTETIIGNTATIISNSNQILSSVQVLLTGNVNLLYSSSQIYSNTTTLINTTNNLIYSSSQIFNNTVLLINSSSSDITLASVNTIVSGVWNAASATFNTSGTMGWIQNQTYTNTVDVLSDTLLLISGVNAILGQTTNVQDILASGSVSISLSSINTFVSSVWQANDSTFNTSGTMGWLQNLIDDIRVETSQTLNNTTTIANGVTASLDASSITAVVSGVWSAASGAYEASGTMGWLQNQIIATSASLSASVSVDNDAIAAAVWNTLTSSMTTPGSAGAVLFTQADALAVKISEIYQILGLELGSPMTVSQVQRTVAAITQSISGDPTTTVTVTRT